MTPACFYSWAGQFESYMDANPEDRFSHDGAQMDSSNLLGQKNPGLEIIWFFDKGWLVHSHAPFFARLLESVSMQNVIATHLNVLNFND